MPIYEGTITIPIKFSAMGASAAKQAIAELAINLENDYLKGLSIDNIYAEAVTHGDPVVVENPPMCLGCGDKDEIQEHSWVFTRHRITFDEHGEIDYGGMGAEVEWDVSRPYSWPETPTGGVTLWCDSCQHSWDYIPPSQRKSIEVIP